MYNNTYINDFAEDDYKTYLNNINKLNIIKKEYLEQYSSSSNALTLAFKESLDHYVLKKLISDTNYIESIEFKNYLTYIMETASLKKISVNNKQYNSEISTNIVFRNPQIRYQIFKRYYNDVTSNILNKHIAEIMQEVKKIAIKMQNRENITQEELDFICDYIYSSRDFSNELGKICAEYIFNEITPTSNIKVSTPILGAITSYFAQCYTKDDDVKNSRMFIASKDSKSRDLAHKSGNRKYCYFNQFFFNQISLYSDNSLNKSRTINNKDLYFLMMVSFHELTHEYQNNEKNRKKTSSSAMATIIKEILNKNLTGYIKLDKNGNPISTTEYTINHDSSEYEMQADEEAWRQCQNFIAIHCREYAYHHQLNSKPAIKREVQCLKNEQEIRARRTFSLKKDKNGQLLYYALYDIKNLIEIIKRTPSILDDYPILKEYMDNSGKLDTSILFSSNITSEDSNGLKDDNVGLEFATYMLDFGQKKILEKISSRKLVKKQILNLVQNIYNIMHQNVLKIRNFEKVQKSHYDETSHNFDFLNHSNEIYNYFFIKNANEIYNAMEILYKIYECYPQIEVAEYNDTKYYISYFYELIAKVKDINPQVIESLCKKYDSSNAPILIELSNYMKTNLLKIQNDDTNTYPTSGVKRS